MVQIWASKHFGLLASLGFSQLHIKHTSPILPQLLGQSGGCFRMSNRQGMVTFHVMNKTCKLQDSNLTWLLPKDSKTRQPKPTRVPLNRAEKTGGNPSGQAMLRGCLSSVGLRRLPIASARATCTGHKSHSVLAWLSPLCLTQEPFARFGWGGEGRAGPGCCRTPSVGIQHSLNAYFWTYSGFTFQK